MPHSINPSMSQTIDISNVHQNKAILALGLSDLAYYVGKLQEPIISVGSGNGSVEQCLENINDCSIICVDPKPNSFQPNFDQQRKPNFSTVSDLISKNPKLVENCDLLINWPTPNDFDAIIDLKPKRIVLVVGTDGSSGGDKLLSSLQKKEFTRCNADFYYAFSKYAGPFAFDNYDVVASKAISKEDPINPIMGKLAFRYMLLVRQDLLNEQSNFDDLNQTIQEEIEQNNGEFDPTNSMALITIMELLTLSMQSNNFFVVFS